MLLGTRDSFTYLECGQCGCVQLLQVPADIAKYYPPNYYSFQEHGWIKTFIRRQWSAYAYGHKNLIGWALTKVMFPNLGLETIRRAGIPKTARILDVGCGSGRLLLDLQHLGFTSLTGADPFIGSDLNYQNGVKVYKRSLAEMTGEYDLITFHYSFEHMDKPAEIMYHAQRLLSVDGVAIIRIPVASSYAWQKYGISWFNLDPPRHFFIHTYKSIELLAKQVGLKITHTVQEGGGATFWYSEDYQRDIPANDPRFIGSSYFKKLRNWKLIRSCHAKSEEANLKGESDLVGFFLRKAI